MAIHVPLLDEILAAVKQEIADAKRARPETVLRRLLEDVPPGRSFRHALSKPFGLIAEIKVRSPSMGEMRPENVAAAPKAYDRSSRVRAISILTNQSHFGMNLQKLSEIRTTVSKPVLRKDFIIEPYQVLESRAFGADAILLMSQLLDPTQIMELRDLALALGMDVLVECHTREQIERIPPGTSIFGINSRSFHSRGFKYGWSKFARSMGAHRDYTTSSSQFHLVRHVPAGIITIAESGIRPESLPAVRDLGFNAALIGTSLLVDPRGVEPALAAFEEAVEIEPGYAWAHNGRGGVLHDLKHHEEALAAYDEAIRIQPEYATSHYNKGNVLYALMCNGQYLI